MNSGPLTKDQLKQKILDLAKTMDPKWIAFCDHYMKTGHKADSYVEAGFTANARSSQSAGASRLLKEPKINDYIEFKKQLASMSKILDLTEALELMTEMARGEAVEERIVVEGTGQGYSKAKMMTVKTPLTVKRQSIKDAIEFIEKWNQQGSLNKRSLADEIAESAEKLWGNENLEGDDSNGL